MYRNKTATLNDLLDISANKPLGYKLINDLKTLSKVDPNNIEEQLKKKGLSTLMLTGSECSMKGGALYAWHEKHLKALLKQHQKTLQAYNWPINTSSFVKRCAIEWADEKTPLFDIIADAFGDKTHPGRTNIRAMSCKDSFNKDYIKKLHKIENKNLGLNNSNPNKPSP